MKKSTIAAVAALMVMNATSCVQGLQEDTDLKDRVARLEERCDALNRELNSLSTIVAAMGSGDWITDVVPVSEDGVVTGYVVVFHTHGPVTVTCGKDGKDGEDGKDGADGKDGKTPQLSVITLEDGNLYWTIDGELVKDSSGKPVQATGMTPQMKIEEGKWFVSYDGGGTWTYAGPATAIPEGQVVFKDVVVDTQAGTVTFTLQDGSTFSASLKPSVEIVMDAEGLEAPIVGGETITIGYSLSGADENTVVTASSDGNYKVSVKSEGTKGGKILVTAPKEYTDGFVNVILSNGRGYSFVNVINFYERKGSVSGGGHEYEYAAATQGGSVEIPISINFPYTVKMDASWIEFVGTKAPSLHTDRLQLMVQKNENTYARTGKVYIYPENNPEEAFLTIIFNQASAYFSIDKTQFIAEAEGGTFTTTVRTSKDFTVQIPSDVNWLTSRVSSVGDDEYTITLTASGNTGTDRRQADVKLVGNNNATLASLFVIQYASNEDDRAAMIITVRANYANDFTVGVPVYSYYSNDSDILIDWGDGIIEHWTTAGYSPTHTYEGFDKGRTFDVKITGTVKRLSTEKLSIMQKESILSVKQWGKLGVTYLYSYPGNRIGAFEGCENLTSIPNDTDYSFANVLSARGAFSGCTGLRSIPDHIFASCSSTKDFGLVFHGCTGITTLPKTLFESCTSATDFESAFRGCTGLKSLPGMLFENCISAKNFSGCFAGCTSLGSLPQLLFQGCMAAEVFSYCFDGCTSLTSPPNHVFKTCISARFYDRCFQGCTSIQSLPEYLFDDGASIISFTGCFSGCTGLEDVHHHLLRACPSVEDFSYCFLGCTSLRSIPYKFFWPCTEVKTFMGCFSQCNSLESLSEDIFAACKEVTDFSYCFLSCSGLTSLSSDLFKYCQSVKNLRSTFSGCTGLKKVPADIFYHNRKVDDFGYTFSGCRSIEGESPYMLIDHLKVHLYERADYPDYFHAPVVTDGCFKGCTSLTDYDAIPSSWQ